WGALTHGTLYSQSKENSFVGSALVDAHNYGERQAWLGLILTPSACRQLECGSQSLEDLAHYRPVSEPGIILCEPSSPVHAFAFNDDSVGGANPYLSILSEMRFEAPAYAKEKYDRTISFIQKHARPRR